MARHNENLPVAHVFNRKAIRISVSILSRHSAAVLLRRSLYHVFLYLCKRKAPFFLTFLLFFDYLSCHVSSHVRIGYFGDWMKGFLYLVLLFLLLVMPGKGSEAAIKALKTWALDLVPSLFPYMVLCQTLTQTLNRKAKKASFFPFFLGMVGGSPSASAALSIIASKQPIKRKKLLFLASLSGTISPMFYLGVSSSWFGSNKTSYQLLFSQYAAAVLTGLLLCFVLRNNSIIDVSKRCSDNLTEANDPIAKSVYAVLSVGGCIVFYSTAAAYIPSELSSLIHGLPQTLHAVFEISGGLHALASIDMDPRTCRILSGGLCSFGSLSILSQNRIFLQQAGLKNRELLFISLMRGFFGAFVMFLLCVIH